MSTLYTAVGRLKIQTDSCGHRFPVVIISGKEFLMDIHEMIIWICLSWRILRMSEIQSLYCQKIEEAGCQTNNRMEIYLERLLRRGLAASGSGETDSDALHNLLSDLYIIPAHSSLLAKTALFLKLTVTDGLPFSKALQLFFPQKLSPEEKEVLSLARQACLSTAEIMKCVETGARDISTDEKVMEAVYDDDFTTCDNIGGYARLYKTWKPALTTVADLYLRRLILLERIV
jgi:hypothetical protein